MLIMSGSFGLWRPGMISKDWSGPARRVVLVCAGHTWMSSGFWAPTTYSR